MTRIVRDLAEHSLYRVDSKTAVFQGLALIRVDHVAAEEVLAVIGCADRSLMQYRPRPLRLADQVRPAFQEIGVLHRLIGFNGLDQAAAVKRIVECIDSILVSEQVEQGGHEIDQADQASHVARLQIRRLDQ